MLIIECSIVYKVIYDVQKTLRGYTLANRVSFVSFAIIFI